MNQVFIVIFNITYSTAFNLNSAVNDKWKKRWYCKNARLICCLMLSLAGGNFFRLKFKFLSW